MLVTALNMVIQSRDKISMPILLLKYSHTKNLTFTKSLIHPQNLLNLGNACHTHEHFPMSLLH